jgi:hypothetical protein
MKQYIKLCHPTKHINFKNIIIDKVVIMYYIVLRNGENYE